MNLQCGMNRRRFLIQTASSAALACAVRTARAAPMASFDRAMQTFMKEREIPGGALAVVRHGKLIFAKGYGLADVEGGVPAQANSLFRIASISKPVTALAVLALLDQGRLALDDKAAGRLKVEAHRAKGSSLDRRIEQITVRQLLQHTCGWDRAQSFDPMFRSRAIAEEIGVEPPASTGAILRYMWGRSLDFDPGQRYAYSNFGYCVLGRLIEAVTGKGYEEYLRESVLAPMGIHGMRLGRTRSGEQWPDEVKYYTTDTGLSRSVFVAGPVEVASPYGGFYLEAMDAHGGWVASVTDLARFAAAFDGGAAALKVRAETAACAYEPPPPPAWRNGTDLNSYFYGLGWMVRPQRTGANYWHNGSLPGTYGILVRRWDGLSWVALFNKRSGASEFPDSAIDPALHRAADAVGEWPASLDWE